jgi:beta-glucanase (GH16 family)
MRIIEALLRIFPIAARRGRLTVVTAMNCPRFSVILLFVGSVVSHAAAPPQPGSLLPGGADQWKLTWSDEFDYPDAELEKKWTSQNAPSTHILSSRWRENAKVEGGTLRLINRKENRGGQKWTSGNIWSNQQFQYGYFECRYRYAAAEGTNNSFWLMTRHKTPPLKGKSFEIDINEGHYPSKINTNIHNWSDIKVVNGKKTHPSSSKSFSFAGKHDFGRDFHTYGLEWNENELVFFLDGKAIRREKNSFCHSEAPIWLSLAIIGWGGKITDAIDGTFMEVDYVRVYQRK